MRFVKVISGLIFCLFLIQFCGCARHVRAPVTAGAGPDDVISYYEDRAREVDVLVSDLRIETGGVHLFGMMCLKRGAELEVLVQGYTPLGSPGFELIASGSRFQLFLPSELAVYSNDPDLLGGVPDDRSSLIEFAPGMIPPGLLLDQLCLVMGELRRNDFEYAWKEGDEGSRLVEMKGGEIVRRMWFKPGNLLLERVEVYSDGGLALEAIFKGHRSWFTGRFWFVPRGWEFLAQGEKFLINLDNVRINPEEAPSISFRPPSGFRTILLEGG